MTTSNPESFDAAIGHETRPPTEPPYAGYPSRSVPQLRDPRIKSPVLAAVLSLVPGLGQVYVGYYPRGFVNIIVVAGLVSILSSSQGDPPYIPLLAIFLVFFWLYNVIDAARLASLYNQTLAGGHQPDLPEGFKLPGIGGSIFGGLMLIASGFVLLLHTRWGIRLDWVEEWWPAFPMLFGAYLVGKAILERGARRPGN